MIVIIDLLSDTEEEDFGYSGLEGKMKAFYDWRVIPFQALVLTIILVLSLSSVAALSNSSSYIDFRS